MEKIVYKRLNCFLTDNNILTSEQFGFREKSTTDVAAYVLLNNIQLYLKKKNLWVEYSVISKRYLIV